MRVFFRLPAILTLLALLPAGLRLGAAELTAAGAEERAVQQHPGIKASRYRIAEAVARLHGAGLRPNPELEVEGQHDTSWREMSLSVGFVQKFPAAAKLRLEREVSQSLVEAAAAELRAAEREVRMDVRKLCVQVLGVNAQLALRERQAANTESLTEFTRKRADAGEVPATETTQLELETQQIRLESLQLTAERTSLLGQLRPLLGVPAEEPLALKGTLSAPAPAAGPDAAQRPEVQAADHAARAAEQAVELEKNRVHDDISVGLYAGAERTEDAPEGLQNEGTLGLKVSIPLNLWSRNEAKIEEAAATAGRLKAEREALLHRLRAEAAAARAQMQAQAALLQELDSTLLPKSRELVASLEKIQASGQGTLTDVLRARERLLQLERTRIDALRDYHLARAALGTGL